MKVAMVDECTRISSHEERLDRSLVRGIAWTGSVKWFSQALSWLSTILVARLLLPEDYGLIAMASTVLGLVSMLNEFGLGSAIVMLPNLSEKQIAQLHGLAFFLGLAGFIAIVSLAMPVAEFYGAPQLRLILVAMGTGFVITALRSVPTALLERELQFKVLALLEGGQSILTAVVIAGLAWSGFGYWALVWGGIVGTAFATIMASILRPQQFSVPRGQSLCDVLQFSGHVLASRVSWYLCATADLFVGGRVLGATAVGVYSFGCTLANVPVEKVTALVNRVTPAFYSAIQSDVHRIQRYLLLLTEGLALVTFPIGVGLALVADDFVPLLLGEKWQVVVPPLKILACYAALRSVTSLVSPILFVTGGSRLGMWNGVFGLVTFPLGFWIGSHWGTVGLAWTWVIVHPLNLVLIYWYVMKAIKLSVSTYLRAMMPAFFGVLVMSVAVYGMRSLLPADWPAFTRVSIEVAGGVLGYGLSAFIVCKDRVREIFRLINSNPW